MQLDLAFHCLKVSLVASVGDVLKMMDPTDRWTVNAGVERIGKLSVCIDILRRPTKGNPPIVATLRFLLQQLTNVFHSRNHIPSIFRTLPTEVQCLRLRKASLQPKKPLA